MRPGASPTREGSGSPRSASRPTTTARSSSTNGQCSNVPNIYAVGDVTDRLNLTPVAIAEGRAVAETLFNNNPIKMDHADVPTAVFSQPPIGTVGLTEEQAREQYGDDVDVYCARFRPMKNTLVRARRAHLDEAGRRCAGATGCSAATCSAPTRPRSSRAWRSRSKCGASKRMFDQTVGIHPSAAEEFVTMREKLVRPKKLAAD